MFSFTFKRNNANSKKALADQGKCSVTLDTASAAGIGVGRYKDACAAIFLDEF